MIKETSDMSLYLIPFYDRRQGILTSGPQFLHLENGHSKLPERAAMGNKMTWLYGWPSARPWDRALRFAEHFHNLISPLTRTLGFPVGSDSKESACSAEDFGSIPALGRFPGEGNF